MNDLIKLKIRIVKLSEETNNPEADLDFIKLELELIKQSLLEELKLIQE